MNESIGVVFQDLDHMDLSFPNRTEVRLHDRTISAGRRLTVPVRVRAVFRNSLEYILF